MTTKAKTYVACILLAGAALLASSLLQWDSAGQTRFFGVMLLTVLAATRKVRLPRSTSNISIGFLFILLGIAEFSFSQTMALAAASALVQSLWTLRRPKLVQVLFNVSVLPISAAAAFWSVTQLSIILNTRAPMAVMPLAMCVFFLVDTALVAGVVALSESRSMRQVWQQCSLWSFPYYLVGSCVAALVVLSHQSIGWLSALMVLPLMYLIYVYYRMYVERAEAQHS
jgi:hypothetical protein